MKKIILKSANALLAAILALFGIAGCSGDEETLYGVPNGEFGSGAYGCPINGFVINGNVTNENGEAINNIQVVRHPGIDTAYTDANGNFRIVNEGFQGGYVLLHIDDVDGDANGSYQSDTAQVILTRNAQGFLGATINKTLKERAE